jgi:hypothetical protein
LHAPDVNAFFALLAEFFNGGNGFLLAVVIMASPFNVQGPWPTLCFSI